MQSSLASSFYVNTLPLCNDRGWEQTWAYHKARSQAKYDQNVFCFLSSLLENSFICHRGKEITFAVLLLSSVLFERTMQTCFSHNHCRTITNSSPNEKTEDPLKPFVLFLSSRRQES